MTQSQLAVHRKNEEKLRAESSSVDADVTLRPVASKPLSVLKEKERRIGKSIILLYFLLPNALILCLAEQKGRGRMPMTYTEKGRETQMVMLRTEVHDLFSDILDRVGVTEDMDLVMVHAMTKFSEVCLLIVC